MRRRLIQSLKEIESDHGSFDRPLGLDAGAKKVLASPDNPGDDSARQTDRIRAMLVANLGQGKSRIEANG